VDTFDESTSTPRRLGAVKAVKFKTATLLGILSLTQCPRAPEPTRGW